MTKDQKDQVQEAVKSWINENDNDRSQNSLHKISKVAPVIIQAIRQGETVYKASKASEKDIIIADSHYYKLAEAVGLKFEREIHFNNENYERVHKISKYIQSKHRRGIIDSMDSGAGKTYALEGLVKNDKKSIYIKATSMMKGRDLILKIMEQLRITPDGKRSVRHLEQITDRFIQPGNLIIIDELEGASPDMWRVIKDIEDATYRKIGMVICGKGLIKEIELAALKNKKLMPQIWRRFKNNRIILKAMSKSDIETACIENGITDNAVIRVLYQHVSDWAQLNEFVKDIHDLIISRGIELNAINVKKLFELDEDGS